MSPAARYWTAALLACAALVAAVAVSGLWWNVDSLRLRGEMVQVASTLAVLGAVAAGVALIVERSAAPRRPRVVAVVALALNAAFATLSVYTTQVGLPVPAHDGFYEPGTELPEFPTPLLDTDGLPVHLADLRGRPVVLHFFRGHW